MGTRIPDEDWKWPFVRNDEQLLCLSHRHNSVILPLELTQKSTFRPKFEQRKEKIPPKTELHLFMTASAPFKLRNSPGSSVWLHKWRVNTVQKKPRVHEGVSQPIYAEEEETVQQFLAIKSNCQWMQNNNLSRGFKTHFCVGVLHETIDQHKTLRH